jgi:non-heme chloroperoxidase
MMFFLSKGYRVIAHDRRGRGRSTQTAARHDMDTYADDAFEVVKELDLKDTDHIKKAALISAIPPLFMNTEKNPDGVPKEVVDGIHDGAPNHRSQHHDAVLRIQSAWRPKASGQLVATRDDGKHSSSI